MNDIRNTLKSLKGKNTKRMKRFGEFSPKRKDE